MKLLSVVVSCFNEELMLDHFYSATSAILTDCSWDYELIFVNDGSIDGSYEILKRLAARNKRVKVVNFSRNFGHEAAMIAGIDYASGDGIICMDADLQHPPQCIPEILSKFEDGFDVISMVRTQNAGAGLVKKVTSGVFYKVLNAMSPTKFQENSSDFFGISSQVASVLRTQYREKVRYLRGYVQSVGFRCTTLEFQAGKREAGESNYSIWKLLKFSIATLCGFSDVPLKLGIYSSLFAALCGVVLIVYSVVMRVCFDTPSGYTTIIVALCFLFALTLLVIGIIGEYVSVLLQEVKQRPIYIVRDLLNLTDHTAER